MIFKIWPKDAPPIDEAEKFLEMYKNKKIVLKYGGQVGQPEII